MKTCFIFNAGAGSAPAAEGHLAAIERRADCALFRPASPSEAMELARSAATRGCTRIVAAGGDGAVHAALNGLAPRFGDVELAVVPLGTGNDLARSLDLDSADCAAAIELALNGRAVPVDIGRMTTGGVETWFLNAVIAGFGADEEAIQAESASKSTWGAIAYWASAVAKITDLPPHAARIFADGRELELDIFGLVVANGRHIGAGFAAAPGAILDDGLLDLVIAPAQPLGAMLAAGIEAMLGRQEESDRIVTLRARRIELSAHPPMMYRVDGEIRAPADAVFEVLPRALRVVAGPRPATVAHADP